MKEVESTSKEFHFLATAVSKKFDDFMVWLNSLPGHVSVQVFDLDSDQDPEGNGLAALGLRIGRGKAGWQLYYSRSEYLDESYEHIRDVHTDRWEAVDSAPLAVRCAALSLLPKLVEEMHCEQSRLVRRLRLAKTALEGLENARTGKGGA
jgi:hypothetical protein